MANHDVAGNFRRRPACSGPVSASELDPATLDACRRGDAAAFRRLVELYRRPVLALCVALAGSDGEDLAQETFVRVHGAIARFDPHGDASLRGWILCIARRLCRDRARSVRRRGARAASEVVVDAAPRGLDPAVALERADRDAHLARAIAALPVDQRAALALYEWEGLAYDEIAVIEQVPVGTVRSRLARAREALRVALVGHAPGLVLVTAPGLSSRFVPHVGSPRRGASSAASAASSSASSSAAPEVSMLTKILFALAAAAGVGLTVHAVRDRAAVADAVHAAAPRATAAPPAAAATAPDRSRGHAAAARLARPVHAAAATGAAAAAACPDGGCDCAAGACAPGAPPPQPTQATFDLTGAPSMGPASAAVTIVELVDFQCPFCEQAVATVHELAALYPDDVRVVIKHLPLPGHRQARPAAIAAMAADRQGKFWEMHELLFANQDRLDPASILGHARHLGLDEARFTADLADPAIAQAIDADAAEAVDRGFQGVPAFAINGRVVIGAQPLAALRAVVDEELARVRRGAP